MKFFDVSSSVEILDLPAETFERKLVGTFHRYNIQFDKGNDEKVMFRTSVIHAGGLRHRTFIFRGVSFGEIGFSNHGKNLNVQFNLSLGPTRVLLSSVAVGMIAMSIVDKHFGPLIMAGWTIILYFIVRYDTRHRFKKWFSRFTR